MSFSAETRRERLLAASLRTHEQRITELEQENERLKASAEQERQKALDEAADLAYAKADEAGKYGLAGQALVALGDALRQQEREG